MAKFNLDSLKSRLGFAGDGNDTYDGNDEALDTYDEEYAEEDDFGEYGSYSGNYADEFSEYGPDYQEPEDPYMTPREKATRSGSFQPGAYTQGRSSRGGAYRNSNLVTIDDVKAHTAIPESLNRDPLPSRSSYSSSRVMVDSSQPAPQAAPSRSEGLDSLFEPTTPDVAQAAQPEPQAPAFDAWDSAFEPAAPAAPAAAASAAPAAHTRGISVLKPVAYGDAERIAKVLRAGDAVVIVLRNTPDELSKRILDFSFGVAAALDASVDCPADKVFAITRGQALSAAEKQALTNQGVL